MKTQKLLFIKVFLSFSVTKVNKIVYISNKNAKKPRIIRKKIGLCIVSGYNNNYEGWLEC